MKTMTKAERAIQEVSELNKLVSALQAAGRKGNVQRAENRKIRESRPEYGREQNIE
jgi:hypothetical protein